MPRASCVCVYVCCVPSRVRSFFPRLLRAASTLRQVSSCSCSLRAASTRLLRAASTRGFFVRLLHCAEFPRTRARVGVRLLWGSYDTVANRGKSAAAMLLVCKKGACCRSRGWGLVLAQVLNAPPHPRTRALAPLFARSQTVHMSPRVTTQHPATSVYAAFTHHVRG